MLHAWETQRHYWRMGACDGSWERVIARSSMQVDGEYIDWMEVLRLMYYSGE